jgi:cytoskeleton protein RodZ
MFGFSIRAGEETAMDLKELGRLLKEERLRQGLDLAEVMEKTKISRVNLEGIEEGNEQALPHPVYAKGFVKNYARFLRLDADKIGNYMTQVYPSEEVSAYQDDLTLKDVSKLPAVKRDWPRQLSLLTLVALLVVFLAGAWFLRAPLQGAFVSALEFVGFLHKPVSEALQEPEPTFPVPTQAEPIAALPEPTLPVPAPAAAEPAGADPLAAVLGEPALPAPEPVEAEPAAAALGGDAQPVVLETMVEAGAAEEAAIQNERTLEIKAFANCWLSVQADGGRVQEAFLRPGERLVVSFYNYLDLRLGNAGGVELFLDGKPWPLRARSGEVLSLRLP